jgi:polyhydroxybutyrate depolymerase
MAPLIGVCVLFGLSACGGDPESGRPAAPASSASVAERPAPGDHRLTLEHGDQTRVYLLHAPPKYDPARPLPLIIALHFYPGTGQGMREMVGLDTKADREGFLVAYPDGVNGGFNALVCCGAADDVGFLKSLTEHLVGTWRADPGRVYLTGISNGGDLSFRAAVEATGVFAAIGVVSGGFIGSRAASADYVPKSPVSVVTFIGAQDRYAAAFQDGVKAWQQRLQCAPTAVKPLPAAPTVTRSSAKCADGSDIDVYSIADMGHQWPGATTGQLAAPGANVVATDVIWDFFAAHPRRP